jgi:heme/copper-type cytochrome/quinol oxidase subunit 4
MDDKTRLPDLTPRSLRFGGLLLILLTAAVPALGWTFATSVVSLAGLFIAASAWAALALAGYLAMGRDNESRVFALLICGCGALWAVVLTAAFWFLVRGEFDVASPVALTNGRMPPGEIMALCGVAAAATGATYGYFSAIRYRDVPRTLSRSLRACAWALVPSVALCLAVFGTDLVNRYALFAIAAPLVLALAVTAVAAAMPRRVTTPAGIS